MISIVQRSPTIAVDRATGHKVSPTSPHFDIVSYSLFFSYPLDDMIFIVIWSVVKAAQGGVGFASRF
jgi:hypothetical protein